MHILYLLRSSKFQQATGKVRIIIATTYVARQSRECDAFLLKLLYRYHLNLCNIYESSNLNSRAREPETLEVCLHTAVPSQITLPREASQPTPLSTNASIKTTVLLIGSLAVTEHIFLQLYGVELSVFSQVWPESHSKPLSADSYWAGVVGVGIVCFVYRSGNGACCLGPYQLL